DVTPNIHCGNGILHRQEHAIEVDCGLSPPVLRHHPALQFGGSSSGSIPRRGLGSSNSLMGLATASSTEAYLLRAASPPSNRAKRSKCVSAPATRGHTSPRC